MDSEAQRIPHSNGVWNVSDQVSARLDLKVIRSVREHGTVGAHADEVVRARGDRGRKSVGIEPRVRGRAGERVAQVAFRSDLFVQKDRHLSAGR
eukprot:XP_001704384.1 Hypothetical protein GL50803_127806 [Giardia lamblia ATCC 50803]